jgi:hypothetical protein
MTGVEYGGVTALNVATGIKLWNTKIGSITFSSPVVSDEVVFVGSDNQQTYPLSVVDGNSFYALNATDGSIIWSYVTGGSVKSSAAVANGIVYVGSDDLKVYAFGLPPETSVDFSPIPVSTSIQSASPSVPEFSWLALLPLLISIFVAALFLKHAKSRNLNLDLSRHVYNKSFVQTGLLV